MKVKNTKCEYTADDINNFVVNSVAKKMDLSAVEVIEEVAANAKPLLYQRDSDLESDSATIDEIGEMMKVILMPVRPWIDSARIAKDLCDRNPCVQTGRRRQDNSDKAVRMLKQALEVARCHYADYKDKLPESAYNDYVDEVFRKFIEPFKDVLGKEFAI